MVAEGLGGCDPPTWATLSPANSSVCRTAPPALRFWMRPDPGMRAGLPRAGGRRSVTLAGAGYGMPGTMGWRQVNP